VDKRTVSLFSLGDNTKSGHGTPRVFVSDQFKQHFNAGMIGINVGVPAPMAWFPFTGWNSSFFGDLHIQGTESIQFYTQQKMRMTRWFESPQESHHDQVWKTGKA
jgi:malonate-semialdehyde dehydrogenase (acetylating) / methylmalonate-semialdehyde dehydrogenase